MQMALLHKSITLILSVLVLFSTLSLTIEKHFCGGELVEVAFFKDLHSCCGDAADDGSLESENASCCKNEVEVVEGQKQLKISTFDDLDAPTQLLIVALAVTFFNSIEDNGDPIPYTHYRPPTIVEDIHILNETYLI